MLLECSLIKSVIFLTYMLYCLKKYTSRVCANFVVLGEIIFRSTYFPPKASSSTCSSLCPDQEPQSTTEFVDKCEFKTYRKWSSGVLSSSSHSHLHLRWHLEEICICNIKISELRVASTMTSAVTSRAHLHRFADKWHSPAHSGPVTEISYIGYMFVRTQILRTFLVQLL